MNHPSKEWQEQIEQRLERLESQRTEPIRITRLEIDQGGMQGLLVQANKRLDSLQEDTNILKIEMTGARADILPIRDSQADQRDRLKEHGQRLSTIETKQDAHTEVLGQLVNLSEGHSKRFDQIDASIAELKSAQTELKSAQTEQGTKLDLILKLLQKGE